MRPNSQRGRPRLRPRAKKPSGKLPRPPTQGPLLTDQINLTDEESRIMPVAGGGFRAMLQRASCSGGGQSSGGCHRCCSSLERQAAARTDARQDRRLAGRTGQRPKRCWPIPAISAQGMCGGLRSGSDRAADRHGPTAASSTSGRALRPIHRPRRKTQRRSRAMAHRLKTPEGRKLYSLR